jgi:hypothetical protein
LFFYKIFKNDNSRCILSLSRFVSRSGKVANYLHLMSLPRT